MFVSINFLFNYGEHTFYFDQIAEIEYNYRKWMYLNLKVWHRLNEQVIQREFEVSSRHRRLNKTQFERFF